MSSPYLLQQTDSGMCVTAIGAAGKGWPSNGSIPIQMYYCDTANPEQQFITDSNGNLAMAKAPTLGLNAVSGLVNQYRNGLPIVLGPNSDGNSKFKPPDSSGYIEWVNNGTVTGDYLANNWNIANPGNDLLLGTAKDTQFTQIPVVPTDPNIHNITFVDGADVGYKISCPDSSTYINITSFKYGDSKEINSTTTPPKDYTAQMQIAIGDNNTYTLPASLINTMQITDPLLGVLKEAEGTYTCTTTKPSDTMAIWKDFEANALTSNINQFDSTNGINSGMQSALNNVHITDTHPFLIVPLSIIIKYNLCRQYHEGGNMSSPLGGMFYAFTFPPTSKYLPVGDICVQVNTDISNMSNNVSVNTSGVPVLLVLNDGYSSIIIDNNNFSPTSRSRGCFNYFEGGKEWSTQTAAVAGATGDTSRKYNSIHGQDYYLIGDLINWGPSTSCWGSTNPNCLESGYGSVWGPPAPFAAAWGPPIPPYPTDIRTYAAVNSKYLSIVPESQTGSYSIDLNNQAQQNKYRIFTDENHCTYGSNWLSTSPYGTFANLNSEGMGSWGRYLQPYAAFDIIPTQLQLKCCMSEENANISYCGNTTDYTYTPGSGVCWNSGGSGILYDYAQNPDNIKNDATFKTWVLQNAQSNLNSEVAAYYNKYPNDDPVFNACKLPLTYPDTIPMIIQDALKSTRECSDPNCASTSAYHYEAMPTCDMNITNCVNIANTNVNGTINGNVNINQTNNCKAYAQSPPTTNGSTPIIINANMSVPPPISSPNLGSGTQNTGHGTQHTNTGGNISNTGGKGKIHGTIGVSASSNTSGTGGTGTGGTGGIPKPSSGLTTSDIMVIVFILALFGILIYITMNKRHKHLHHENHGDHQYHKNHKSNFRHH